MDLEDLEIAKSMPANYAIAYTRFIDRFDRVAGHVDQIKKRQDAQDLRMDGQDKSLTNEKLERAAAVEAVKEGCKKESSDIIKSAAGWSLGALFVVSCSVIGFLAYKL